MELYTTFEELASLPENDDDLNLNFDADSLDSVLEADSVPKANSVKRQSILGKGVDHLTKKFRDAHHWIVAAKSNGKIHQTPCSIRGNAVYAYFQRSRLDDLQRQINERLETDGKTYSNMLFTTHTLKYDTEDNADIERVWRQGKKAIAPFLRKMRRYGMVDYCLAIEAFELAGFHIHIAVIFDEHLSMEESVEYDEKKQKEKIVYRLTDKALEQRIFKGWADAAKEKVEEAKSEVQCCYSKGLAGYLVKELKKVSCAEYAVRRCREGKDSPADRKKVIAFYMADVLGIRLLRVSKGLSSAKAEEEEEIQQGDFFLVKELCNKMTTEENDENPIPYIEDSDDRAVTLFTLSLKKSELFEVVNYAIFEPWTGEISPRAPHYRKIKELFDRIFNFSEIIADKERLKVLIDEKRRLYREKREKKKEAPAVHPVLSLENSRERPREKIPSP